VVLDLYVSSLAWLIKYPNHFLYIGIRYMVVCRSYDWCCTSGQAILIIYLGLGPSFLLALGIFLNSSCFLLLLSYRFSQPTRSPFLFMSQLLDQILFLQITWKWYYIYCFLAFYLSFISSANSHVYAPHLGSLVSILQILLSAATLFFSHGFWLSCKI
jgi:hypothetical protein